MEKEKKTGKIKSNIYLRADGRYLADKTYKGERIIIYGEKVSQVERELRQRMSEIDNHIDRPKGHSKITMEELFEQYLSSRSIKRQSENHYRWTFEQCVRENKKFGKIRLDRLRASDFEYIVNQMADRGMKQGTIDNVRKLFRALMNEAVKKDLIAIQDNPYPKANFPNNLQKKEVGSLKEEEAQVLLDELRKNAGHRIYYNCIYIMIYTGLRAGEVTGLTIDDVDLENSCITVKQNLQYDRNTHEIFVETPKTRESRRKIYITDGVKQCIMDQLVMRKQLQNENTEDSFKTLLFYTKKGTPMKQCNLENVLRKAVVKIREHDEKFPYVHPHMLRHTYASLATTHGMDIRIIKENMGHTNLETTMRYITIDKEYKRQQSLLIGEA